MASPLAGSLKAMARTGAPASWLPRRNITLLASAAAHHRRPLASPLALAARSFSLNPFATSPHPPPPVIHVEVPQGTAPTPHELELAKAASHPSGSVFTSPQINIPTDPLPLAAPPITPNLPREYSPFGVDTTSVGAPPSPILIDTTIDPATIPMAIGDLRHLGLGSFWTPVGHAQNFLELVHVLTGIPWWGTIVGVTLVVRLILFRMFIKGIRVTSQLTTLAPRMKELSASLKEAKEKGDKTLENAVAQQMAGLYRDAGVNPLQPLLMPLVQLPIFLSMFYGLKKMSELPVWQMTVEGIPGWCLDLTVADPLYILPVVSAVMTAALMHIGPNGTPPEQNPPMAYAFSRFFRWASLTLIPISGGFTIPAWVPLFGGYINTGFASAILLYWTTSNTFGFLQGAILRVPRVRTYLDLAPIPPPPVRPPGFRHPSLFEVMNEQFSTSVEKAITQKEQSLLLAKRREAEAVRRKALAGRTERLPSILSKGGPVEGEVTPASTSLGSALDEGRTSAAVRGTPIPPPPRRPVKGAQGEVSAAAQKFLESKRR